MSKESNGKMEGIFQLDCSPFSLLAFPTHLLSKLFFFLLLNNYSMVGCRLLGIHGMYRDQTIYHRACKMKGRAVRLMQMI